MSDLQRKINLGEGVHLDFKFEIEDQKKIARTLVAFANTDGGSLLIGVKDNGKIVGTNPEEEYYMVEAAADFYCKPPIKFESKVWQEDRFLVLEIIVPKGVSKHKAIDEEGKWRSYIRVEDHTFQGNKILDRVWKLQEKGQPKPLEFDQDCVGMIGVLKSEGACSLSKIYRKSLLPKNVIDSLIALLVYWEVVQMEFTENGTVYYLDIAQKG